MDINDLCRKLLTDVTDNTEITQNKYEIILNLINDIKLCSVCKEQKHISKFCKTGKRCKKCHNEYTRNYLKNKYIPSKRVICNLQTKRLCKLCNIVKDPENFYKNSRYQCKSCLKELGKKKRLDKSLKRVTYEDTQEDIKQ